MSSPPRIQKELPMLCRRFGIEILYVFGSRAGELRCAIEADGNLRPGGSSDVDLAVKMSQGQRLAIREKVNLAIALEDLLGVGKVDLVLLSEADPFLAVNIIRGERLYCVDEDGADDYDLYVLRRAGDLARFERERIEKVLSR
jgi:uncharacterized protein